MWQEEENSYTQGGEDINLLVRKFKKFTRHDKKPQNFQHKNEERPLFVSSCF